VISKEHIMNCRHPIFTKSYHHVYFIYNHSVAIATIPLYLCYSMIHHSVGIPLYSIIFDYIRLHSSTNTIEIYGCKPFVYHTSGYVISKNRIMVYYHNNLLVCHSIMTIDLLYCHYNNGYVM
jgi:hypothetical protein